MTEIFLDQKNDKIIDLQGTEADCPARELAHHTLLVCKKLFYTHENHYLTAKQVNDLFTLTREAHTGKRALNRFITIHLKDIKDLKIKTAQNLLSNVMEKTRKWLQRNGFDHAHIWVLENGEVKGIHAHILVHIPNNYIHQYKRLLKKWLSHEVTDSTLNIKKVKYPQWGQLGERSCVYGALRYMCKGIDLATPIHGIRPEYQGEVIGRRCGHSPVNTGDLQRKPNKN